ncbi:ATP-binding cassette domain-containing protein [Bifidobacterium leontopitheci]|uniref:ABC transporter n=1 Tax=Bifidobacterium leontopitheci TaxID=2650774 RepID=A0A6I1GG16_9BIFI|nr:ATP-binding cassette domain-containing protein [Bifidobacterium leontopitheci]KAB7790583.1 ABC transporter [Bifidobacterium leontopitheci]
MEASVTLHDVGHTFDPARQDFLFRHVTVDLHPRHVYALVGPSGSGKSTLLSIIAGWVTPTEGEVRRDRCGRVGWIMQNPHGVARRAAVDHVALPFIARGESRQDATAHAMKLIDVFGLRKVAAKPFRDLSGGEAQRLMLARGVASHAGLLLVDEPTAQLDLRTAVTVNERLRALSLSGAIVVVATHDRNTREACTDVIDLRDFQDADAAADSAAPAGAMQDSAADYVVGAAVGDGERNGDRR